MRILILLLLFIGYKEGFSQTLTAGYVPCQLQGGSTPISQNCSIYDTGSSSGAGNVGINTTNPGQRLDVEGTIRSNGFVEVSIPTATKGGLMTACFNSSGQLVSVPGGC